MINVAQLQEDVGSLSIEVDDLREELEAAQSRIEDLEIEHAEDVEAYELLLKENKKLSDEVAKSERVIYRAFEEIRSLYQRMGALNALDTINRIMKEVEHETE